MNLEAGTNGNPISRLARLFDSQLVKVEDRVAWLETQLTQLAPSGEYPLRTGIGYRGARSTADSEDPSITMDLGTVLPLEEIFLIPTQQEFLNDRGIFPKRFTIEVSKDVDFAESSIVYRSGQLEYPSPGVTPVLFNCRQSARYVRLSVQEGHMKESNDVYGLSEIIVTSNEQPVSFGAKVSTFGSLNTPDLWYPEALTDGRTPLGIWESSKPAPKNPSDVAVEGTLGKGTSWKLQFDKDRTIEHIILFPHQIESDFQTLILPDSLEILLTNHQDSTTEKVFTWTNPMPGSSQSVPLVIPLYGKVASSIQIASKSPWTMGQNKLHAISEIQVWSDGMNIASGQPAIREHNGTLSTIQSLTDGSTAARQIIPVGKWLKDLRERSRLEYELSYLRDVQHQLASNSELNATWGSAVVLGLTFLIPVFIVERRRMMSKNQLETIRKRIASDLHDDIGSNLGSISLIARTARKDLERLHGPEEIADDLDEVESIARESSLAMRDIVWLLERQQDSIGDLVQRMRDTAGRLLREIEYKIECESSKTTAKLTLDAKRHLFLFYKEAIHNVLKHSHANQVSVRLWDQDDKLALEIIDNGIGIPHCDKNLPQKVNKLTDRARVLDGSLQIKSAKGQGTQIRLLVKRSHLINHPAFP